MLWPFFYLKLIWQPQYWTWPLSYDITLCTKHKNKSVKPLMSYRPETIWLFFLIVTLTLTPPALTSNLTVTMYLRNMLHMHSTNILYMYLHHIHTVSRFEKNG